MSTDFQTVVNSVGDLPPMPAVAVKVIELLQDPNASAGRLARTIAHDPALSARVLKIANSSFYSMKRQVRTLESAIVVMGEKTLRSLVLAASLKGMNKSFGLLEKMLWEDSIGCAIGARIIAQRMEEVDTEEAFVAGLFRHLGKVVLNYSHPEEFQSLMQAVYNGEGSLTELEGVYFPYSHALVGAAVLNKWNFSDGLVQSALHHADLDIDAEEEPAILHLAAVVNAAGCLCQRLGIGQREPAPHLDVADSKGALTLEFSNRCLEEIEHEIGRTFSENREYFLG
jgi:HD-like signal output (HDOD) protein